MMKRTFALILMLCLLVCLFGGCARSENEQETTESSESVTQQTQEELTRPEVEKVDPLQDHYRNWYEIFVYSYFDSNGDGIGDLNGVTEKLNYIYDMGFNGIWLMPVMPSPSYHKYDVTDYYGIDPQYGTIDDMRALLSAAHELGMLVIIDFPVNHTSSEHPWFQNARMGADSEYRDYYVWSDTSKTGYSPYGDSYYESRFVYSMPDLNLDNEKVRGEIADIMTFWLEDVSVDGFRLDAVTSYYTGAVEKNIDFITWLGETAREVNPDAYIVAEAWTDLTTIGQYSEAKIDSFFTFSVSQQEGSIAKILSPNAKTPGESYGKTTLRIEEVLAEHSIAAPFLGNHDTSRPANFIGRSKLEKLKMAGGLLAMLPGNPFIYYGEEIGMTGKGDDPNKRIGMLWTTESETTKNPPGTTESGYYFPSVSEQQEDPESLLNYYRAAMWLRHANPEIARGTSEVLDSGNPEICIIRRTWEESAVTIVVNPSTNTHSVEAVGELVGQLDATQEYVCQNEDGTLTMPPYSIAILR